MAGLIGSSISITENIFHAGNAEKDIYFSAVNSILGFRIFKIYFGQPYG